MTSRYAQSAHLTCTGPDGLRVDYLAPRILPQALLPAARRSTTVHADEVNRLDLLAYRVFGQPLLAYRVADANIAMTPLLICRHAGARVTLPRSGS